MQDHPSPDVRHGQIRTEAAGRVAGVEAQIERVFVSPRVVDQRTFDELSSTLKVLLSDAAGQSRVLIGATGEIRSLGEQVRSAKSELQTKIDTAVRLIPTIDQRLARVEQLIDSLRNDVSARIEVLRGMVREQTLMAERARVEAEKKVAGEMQSRMEQFERRLAAAERAGQARTSAKIVVEHPRDPGRKT